MRRRISSNKLAAAIKERGATDGGKIGYDRFWAGIRLKNEDERITAEKTVGFQDILPVS